MIINVLFIFVKKGKEKNENFFFHKPKQNQVDTRTFPDVPKYNKETDVILFPGPVCLYFILFLKLNKKQIFFLYTFFVNIKQDAKLLHEMDEKEFKSIRKIIVLDSQWSNVKNIYCEKKKIKKKI